MILVLLFLTLLNALFAMSEMALVSAKRPTLQRLSDDGDKGASVALMLSNDPPSFLSTIQIGITSISILSGIFGEAALSKPLAEWLIHSFQVAAGVASVTSTIAVVMLVTYLSIVLGELVPKRIGQMYPDKIAPVASLPIFWLSQFTKPLVYFLSSSTSLVLKILGIKQVKGPAVTQEEIHAILSEGSESGILDEQEHQMLRNVIRLDDRRIAGMMVPKLDIVWLSTSDSDKQLIDIVTKSEFSRFPVCRENINEVIGVIPAKAVLAAAVQGQEIDLEKLMAPPLFVPESLNAMELLNELRDSGLELAIIVDEYGDVQGLVTLQNVLEAITGEFPSTDDEDESFAIEREDGSWLLDGLIPIQDLKDHLHIKTLPDEERTGYNTLSGLMMSHLGRIPETTDTIVLGKWKLEIVDMDGKRIDKVLAIQMEESESGDQE